LDLSLQHHIALGTTQPLDEMLLEPLGFQGVGPHLATHGTLVSVCPTGRRLAACRPTGCPTERPGLTSGPAIAPLDHSATSLAFDCSANSDPVGVHPEGVLCLDTQQMSLGLLKGGPHSDGPISLVDCSTGPRWAVSLFAGVLSLRGSVALPTRHCHGLDFGACQVGLVPDSGLDASSQYPSLGSFTTPVARLMVETRGVPQGFLSYYHVMPSSRPSQERCLPRITKDPSFTLLHSTTVQGTSTLTLVGIPLASAGRVGLQHQSGALSVAGG